jgi:hypothetical protein
MIKRLLLVLAQVVALLVVFAPISSATDCGLGTYYDPPTDSCRPLPNPVTDPPPGYGYGSGSNWSQFCFSGFLFSYCTGNSSY